MKYDQILYAFIIPDKFGRWKQHVKGAFFHKFDFLLR